MTRIKDIKKNNFLVRIQDDDILSYIYDLLNSGIFASQNELLNRCLEAGVPEVYKEQFQRYPKGCARDGETIEEQKTQKELKELRLTVDELFVLMNISESLLATLYNTKLKEIEGESITSEMFDSGLLADLPPVLAEAKQELVKRHLKKGERR